MKVVRQLQASTEAVWQRKIVNTLLEETKELKLPDEYIQHNMVPGRDDAFQTEIVSAGQEHWSSARMEDVPNRTGRKTAPYPFLS